MDIEITGTYPIIIDGQEIGSVSVTREGLFWVFVAQSEMLEDILRLSVFGEGSEGYLGVMTPEGGNLRLKKKLSRSGVSGFPTTIEYAGRSGEPNAVPSDSAADEPALQADIAADTVPTGAFSAGDKAEVNDNASADEKYSPVDVDDDDTPPAAKKENDSAGAQEHYNPVDVEDDSMSDNDSSSMIEKRVTPQESVMPPPASHVRLQNDLSWRPCALPCSVFSDVTVKMAMGEMKGAMIANEGNYTLLAVPLSLAHEIDQHSIRYFNKTTQIGETTYVVCRIRDGKPYEASR